METLVAIPAVAPHRPVVELSLSRLRECLPDAQVLIVTPTPDAFNDLAGPGVRIEHDKRFAPITKQDMAQLLDPSKRHLPGWYYQQLLKYAIVASSDAVRTLILDADTVVLRDLRCEAGTFFTSRERNEGYFEHYRRFVGKDAPLKASAVTNFMWFDNAALRAMLSMTEARHGQPWWQSVIAIANGITADAAFSEYETYANWYAAEFGRFTEVPIDMFRRADLLLRNDGDHARVLEAIRSKRYDAAAFELHHRSSWARRVSIRAVFRLGLRAW